MITITENSLEAFTELQKKAFCNESRRSEILNTLSEIDKLSIRSYRELALNLDVDYNTTKLTELNANAEVLRVELGGL